MQIVPKASTATEPVKTTAHTVFYIGTVTLESGTEAYLMMDWGNPDLALREEQATGYNSAEDIRRLFPNWVQRPRFRFDPESLRIYRVELTQVKELV